MMGKIFILLTGAFLLANGQDAADTGTVPMDNQPAMKSSDAQAGTSADAEKERLDAVEGKLAGFEESYLETQATVKKLARL